MRRHRNAPAGSVPGRPSEASSAARRAAITERLDNDTTNSCPKYSRLRRARFSHAPRGTGSALSTVPERRPASADTRETHLLQLRPPPWLAPRAAEGPHMRTLAHAPSPRVVRFRCRHCTPRGPKPLICQHCGQQFVSVLDGPFDMDRSVLLDWILALKDLLCDLQASVEEGRV
jgi:hypothetical protein